MIEVSIEKQPAMPVSRREVEYVERKGIGHPDSICDAVMESISVALSRKYLEVAGQVLGQVQGFAARATAFYSWRELKRGVETGTQLVSGVETETQLVSG